jgi:hypothetical protein
MPNWFYNTVTITTQSPKALAAVKGAILDKDGTFCLSNFAPMPKEYETHQPELNTPEFTAWIKSEKSQDDRWYHWCNTHWSTKWIYDIPPIGSGLKHIATLRAQVDRLRKAVPTSRMGSMMGQVVAAAAAERARTHDPPGATQ